MKQTEYKKVQIYTDGSSLGNPGPGGWGAVFLFLDSDDGYVTEHGGNETRTTNNRMELTAVIFSLHHIRDEFPSVTEVSIWTDSQYVISGITKWVHGWEKRNWITAGNTPVLNKDLWRTLKVAVDTSSANVTWNKVTGHVGVPGNERADVIATSFAEKSSPELFSGTLATYPYGDLKQTQERRQKKGSGKAHSYLSLVDGILKRHETWDACKKRVSGKRRARFRKALSEAHEREILEEWGVKE